MTGKQLPIFLANYLITSENISKYIANMMNANHCEITKKSFLRHKYIRIASPTVMKRYFDNRETLRCISEENMKNDIAEYDYDLHYDEIKSFSLISVSKWSYNHSIIIILGKDDKHHFSEVILRK